MNAAQRKEYWRKVERLRAQLDAKYFEQVRNSIIAQFKRFARDIEAIGIDAARSRLGLDLWDKEMLKIFEAMYKESVVLFGNSVYRALKIEANQKAETFGFNREWTDAVLEFLLKQGFVLVADITSTTKKKLLDIVSKGIEEGMGVDEIVRIITSDDQLAYATFRARRIVRTEVMRSSNIGAMKGAEAHPFVVDKEWISARDSRTRRIPQDEFDHVELDGVIVGFDEPFTSTGKKGEPVAAMQPGDITAPAGFTINCRCTVAFIPKRDANGRLIMKPKLNAPVINPVSQLPPPIIPQQQQQPVQPAINFVFGKNNRETAKNLQAYIKQKTGLNISSTRVSTEISTEEFNKKTEQLLKLFDEYKVGEGLDNESDVSLTFSSTKRFLGVVEFSTGVTMSGRVLKKASIRNMNFGSRNERLNEVTFVPNSERTRFSSAIDEENLQLGVVTHEFAHVLAISNIVSNPSTPQYVKDYFRELRLIKDRYVSEMLELNQKRDRQGVYNMSIGQYASTNIDEFHAEAFKEYKLKRNPSKYAREVGLLIDKYFKK